MLVTVLVFWVLAAPVGVSLYAKSAQRKVQTSHAFFLYSENLNAGSSTYILGKAALSHLFMVRCLKQHSSYSPIDAHLCAWIDRGQMAGHFPRRSELAPERTVWVFSA